MSETKSYSLIKPTLDTPFYIDFDWWQENDRNWRVYLRSLLCPEHQEKFADWDEDKKIDWVDPETAEVKQMDALLYTLMTHCALQPDFLTDHTPLVEAVFRYLLASGNRPMSIRIIADALHRSEKTILRTFSGKRVYRGVRPLLG